MVRKAGRTLSGALYTLGLLPWIQFLAADREARGNEKMGPEDSGPLKDPKERAAMKEKYWQSLTDGIEYKKKRSLSTLNTTTP